MVGLYCTYSLYYLVLYWSSDLCAVYYYWFVTPKQIIRTPCSTNESGSSRRFPPPDTPQEPMDAIPIWNPLPSVPQSHPNHFRSVWSVCPIQPVASQFTPFYQPDNKKIISPRKPIPWLIFQPPELKSKWRQYQSIIPLLILPLYFPCPLHPLLWRETQQASHIPSHCPKIQFIRENHIFIPRQPNINKPPPKTNTYTS